MACVHSCPVMIKITTSMRDFVADDMCYELAARLTNIKFYEKCVIDEIECMRQSAIKLTSLSLTSRGEKAPKSLNFMTIIKTLKSHFNAGTEESKANANHNELCPL